MQNIVNERACAEQMRKIAVALYFIFKFIQLFGDIVAKFCGIARATLAEGELKLFACNGIERIRLGNFYARKLLLRKAAHWREHGRGEGDILLGVIYIGEDIEYLLYLRKIAGVAPLPA